MKSINPFTLLLNLTISFFLIAPAIAETEGERNWENARNIQDIMHSGHVRDRGGFLEFWGDILSTGFGVVIGIIVFFILLFVVIYMYYSVVEFFHSFTAVGRDERAEKKALKEGGELLKSYRLEQDKRNLQRKFRAHKDKIKNNEEGTRTYHLCEQYMKLAKYYVEGKAVDKDLEKAAEYFDIAIEYANQLFSEKIKERKIKEFSVRKKDLLASGS